MLDLFLNLKWLDLVDIALISFIIYQLYILFYKTKTFRILIGLLGLGFIYILVKSGGLFLSTWVFEIFWQSLIFLIIIVFQPEIREVLEKVNLLNLIHGKNNLSSTPSTIETIVRTVFKMAGERIGAIIIFKQKDDLKDLIRDGVSLDGEISEPILLGIFQKSSPTHDGAILIDENRIKVVAGYLPMTERENLPGKYGSRHRASLGLSERSDALIIVVSEERGEVSVAQHSRIKRVRDEKELIDFIQEHIFEKRKKEKISFKERVSYFFLENWVQKLIIFSSVFLFCILIAGQQNYSQSIIVPLEYTKIPSNMDLVSPPKNVKVSVKGPRKTVLSLKTEELKIELDVSLAKVGRRTFHLTEKEINLPPGIELVNIDPPIFRLDFR